MADQEKPFDASDHLIKIQGGKEYLPVAWRLVWLRDQHPEAIIVTELLERTDTFALFKADITIPYGGQAAEGVDMTGGGSATGHGSETKADFGDFIEKAETKAIGRALAALGYGTQFYAEEMDELDGKRGERIVDAPVHRTQPQQKAPERADGARLMILGRDGECLHCNQPISKGTNAFYSPKQGAVWHERCDVVKQPALPVEEDPGPSRE